MFFSVLIDNSKFLCYNLNCSARQSIRSCISALPGIGKSRDAKGVPADSGCSMKRPRGNAMRAERRTQERSNYETVFI